MARRVNKKFLIIMTSIVVVGVLGVFAVGMYMKSRDDYDSAMSRGDAAFEKGDYKAALKDYGIARGKRTQDPVVLTKIGDTLYQMTNEDPDALGKAINSWTNALENQPNHLPALERMFSYADEYVEVNPSPANFQQLRDYANRIARQKPDDPAAQAALHVAALRAFVGGVNPGNVMDPETKTERPAILSDIQAVEGMIEASPQNVELGYYVANAYTQLGFAYRLSGQQPVADDYFRKAESRIDQLLKSNPQSASAHLYASRVYDRLVQFQRTDAARARLQPLVRSEMEKVIELLKEDDPKYIDMQIEAANLIKRFDRKKVEAMFDSLLVKHADHPLVRISAASFFGEDPARRADALALLEKPLKTDQLVGIQSTRAKLYELQALLIQTSLMIKNAETLKEAERKAAIDKVEPLLRRVESELTGTDNIFRAYRLRGDLSLLKGDARAAVQSYDRAVKNLPAGNADILLLFDLARANIQAGQNEEAIRLLTQIVNASPDFAQARFMLIQQLVATRKIAEARRHIDHLDKAQPDHPDILMLRLSTLNPQTDKDQIRAVYEKLPDTDARTLRAKAQAALILEDMPAAERHFLASLEKSPTDIQTIAMLVQFHQMNKQPEKALELVEAKLQEMPGNDSLEMLKVQLTGNRGTPEDNVAMRRDMIEKIEDPQRRAIALSDYFMSQNQPDEALAELKKAEALDPDSTSVRERFLQAYSRKQDWASAEKYLDSLARADADKAGGRLYRAKYQLIRGKTTEAQVLAREATELAPKFAETWVTLGQVQSASGNHQEAAEAFKQALALQSTNLEALRGAISSLYQAGKVQEARIMIDRAREVYPNDANFGRQQLMHILQFSEPAVAVAQLEAAVKASPEDKSAVQLLGAAYLNAANSRTRVNDQAGANKYTAQARTHFTTALKTWPDDYSFYAALVEIARLSGNYADAIAVIDSMSAREAWKDRPEPVFMRADVNLRFNKLDEAEKDLRSVIAKDDKNVEARRRLSNLLVQQNKLDEALAMLEPVLDNPQIQQQQIEMLIAGRRFDEADKLLQANLRQKPNDSMTLALLGFVNISRNQPREAMGFFERSLSADPTNVSALYYRSLLLIQDKQPQAALRDLSQLLAIQDTNVDARLLRAQAYQSLNNRDAMFADLETALLANPENKRVRLTLADAYARESRWPEYERLFRDARALPGGQRDVDYFIGEARMWVSRGDGPRALELLTQAAQLAPDNFGIRMQLFNAMLMSRKYREVLSETDKLMPAIKDQPFAWEIHEMRAVARKHVQGDAQAMEEFGLAIQSADASKNAGAVDRIIQRLTTTVGVDNALLAVRDRAKSDVRWRRIEASLYASKGEFDAAMASIEAALSQIGGADAEEELKALQTAGSIYLMARPQPAAEKAQKVYLKILERRPDDISALNNLAVILSEMVDPIRPEQALIYSKRAYDLVAASPARFSPLIWDTHGWAMVLAGQVKPGILILRDVIDREPFLDAHYHLGEAYLKDKNPAQAIDQFEKAMVLIRRNDENKQPTDPLLRSKVEEGLARANSAKASKDASAAN